MDKARHNVNKRKSLLEAKRREESGTRGVKGEGNSGIGEGEKNQVERAGHINKK